MKRLFSGKHCLDLESNKHLGNVVLCDYDNVYSSCNGSDKGWYYLQIDFDTSNPILTVRCSNL